jgi:hypothetical protein
MKKLLFAFIATALISCGSEKDSDKIGNAQICLDNLPVSATPTQVDACMTAIDGISSAEAEHLRCAGAFMKEGFLDPTKVADAMGSISGGTLGFMSFMSFTAEGTIDDDTTNAANAFSSCFNSGAKGTTLISSFTYISMALYQYMSDNDGAGAGTNCAAAPAGSPLSYDLSCSTNWLLEPTNVAPGGPADNLADPATVDAAAISVQNGLGAVIIATASASCGENPVNEDLCDAFDTAIDDGGGVGSPRGVAVEFIKTLFGIP